MQYAKRYVNGHGIEAIHSKAVLVRYMAQDGWEVAYVDYDDGRHWIMFKREE